MLTQLQTLDERILLFLQRVFKCAFLDAVIPPITHLADGGAVWITAAVLLLIFYRGRTPASAHPRLTLSRYGAYGQNPGVPSYPNRLLGLMLGGALIIGLLIGNLLLKNVFARARPYDVLPYDSLKLLISKPHDFSFPSGHTLHSFAGATVL
ncbi:MAG: phosphatase PAP2 family protein, partial [Oscillospiraceae bacterium]|nr:phosphatase PAP2 family protein [Oscillospiraceae bacterium]